MINLRDFQQQLYSFISRQTDSPDSLNFVISQKNISRTERLLSYRSSYEVGTTECIESDFVVTGVFYGKEAFSGFIREYLTVHTPDTHYINEIGRNLPQYLKTHLPKDASEELVDVATLEWLMIESFYDYFTLTTEKSTLNGPQAICTTSLKLFKSPWPLHKIWAHEESHPKENTNIMVWTTKDRRVHCESLTDLEFKILNGLQANPDLESAIDEIDSSLSTEVVTKSLQEALQQWINLEIITFKQGE